MTRKHPKHAKQRNFAPSRRGQQRDQMWIYGRHPVEAALANPERQILRLVATSETATALKPLTSDRSPAIVCEILERQTIDHLLESGAVHQGMAAQVAPLPDLGLDDIPRDADLIVVLDQVSDPHNVGAILRSAAAFGAAAIIMQDRHSPQSTGALAKAASGAMEWVPIVRVTNLARAMDDLKSLGFWTTGLDGESPQELGKIPLQSPLALVLGAEGAGLRRLTREACDSVVQIPSSRSDLSLNVSNAAAVALYEARRALSN